MKVEGVSPITWVTVPDRNPSFTADLSRLRLKVTPNVEYSISTFVQYNSARDVRVGTLRF